MITTIIFDLAEVYLKGFKGIEHYLEPILKMKPKEIYQKISGEEFIEFMHGEITEDGFWEKIIKRNGWDLDKKHFKKAIRDNFEEIEGTRDIIEELKKKGFKLGLLSVHSKEWIDYCEDKFDYHKLFDSVLYSFEVAVSKPDKKSYLLILEKLDAKPKECLFIDDRKGNIIGAKELGMETIHFKDSGQLKKELESLDLL